MKSHKHDSKTIKPYEKGDDCCYFAESDRMRDSVLARSTTTGLLMGWSMEDRDPKA